MARPLVVYHRSCMDGAAAALAAWLRFGDEAEYRPASYGDPAPTDDEVRGRDVYVLDFSYPRAELVRIAAACDSEPLLEAPLGRLRVIDHHKTAQSDLAGLPFCTFDMDKSGAVLAWEHFTDGGGILHTPELFRYVQDRDLWRWELPHSKEVSAALAVSGALQDFRALQPLLDWHHTGNGRMTLFNAAVQDGAAILRAERQMVERAVATAEEVELSHLVDAAGGNRYRACYSALAVSTMSLQSEIGEALALESARRGRDAVGVIYYKDGPSGKWRVGLRSRDGYQGLGSQEGRPPAPDVSAIAKSFDGGGHRQAAGFECARLPWDV